ncbi:MAG: Leucine dehydrogenase [Chlamydiales bacterium]|nr:Leucine dehydrogenase [Chlamydiales bacterium]MCH9635402.1 Leucine dehydrogenase [Chlamydiales bacterium]MCH9704300.1 leucine dehydrogenase [Chlamydiota bacterium]
MKKTTQLKVEEIEVDGYERVIEVKEENVGLHAIIAIHTSTLGPALGGVRVWPYSSFDEALTDACRLAEGMTHKAAVAETGTGGGKSVIIHRGPKSKELLYAFAEAVNLLEGKYICAEDVGMSVDDVAIINEKTRYVVGLPQTSGNPSIYTAWGTYMGVHATAYKLFGSSNMRGKTVAIQGLGSVGMELARLLFWEGASLVVADVNQAAVDVACERFGARAVPADEILSVECDILAPCALGGILNKESIPKLRCKGIAGATNNQLLVEEDGDALYERGILYAPDYVINSGGLLNVSIEVTPTGYDPAIARDKVNHIYDVLIKIFTLSEEKKMATNRVTREISNYNVEHQIGKRTEAVVFHSKLV